MFGRIGTRELDIAEIDMLVDHPDLHSDHVIHAVYGAGLIMTIFRSRPAASAGGLCSR